MQENVEVDQEITMQAQQFHEKEGTGTGFAWRHVHPGSRSRKEASATEYLNDSDHPTVYHEASSPKGANESGKNPLFQGADHTLTEEDVRALAGGLPRMFALIQDYGDPDGEGVAEVVAYGLALPGGEAATVGVTARGFGSWRSADSAAHRLRSDLVWLGETGG